MITEFPYDNTFDTIFNKIKNGDTILITDADGKLFWNTVQAHALEKGDSYLNTSNVSYTIFVYKDTTWSATLNKDDSIINLCKVRKVEYVYHAWEEVK